MEYLTYASFVLMFSAPLVMWWYQERQYRRSGSVTECQDMIDQWENQVE